MDRRKGIRARGDSLELDFYHEGERIRAALPLSPNKKAHWDRAESKLAAIKYEQSIGTFNLAKHFPDHPKAQRFKKGAQILICEQLDSWLEHKRLNTEKSTWRDYKSAIERHLMPTFGHLSLAELKASDVRNWYQSAGISNQRINNVLIPLRGIFADAYADELIDRNPLDRIEHLRRTTEEPDPFSKHEVDSILSACDGQLRNIFQFAFWTGLRTSELIALNWEDVNLEKELAYIRRTRTRAEEKNRTKTQAGVRQLELLPPALNALRAQQAFTSEGQIFLNPRTGEPWKHDGPLRKTAWRHVLKAAEVRYRKPYNTRHTFASTVLSMGFSPMWVAQQMGHKDWGMIRKVYGRYLPDVDTSVRAKVEAIWSRDSRKGAANA